MIDNYIKKQNKLINSLPGFLQNGEEHYEEFHSPVTGKTLILYDYRLRKTGELFTCIAKSLSEARFKRDSYILDDIKKQNNKIEKILIEKFIGGKKK